MIGTKAVSKPRFSFEQNSEEIEGNQNMILRGLSDQYPSKFIVSIDMINDQKNKNLQLIDLIIQDG